jgi:leucyl-tRNA synthetase
VCWGLARHLVINVITALDLREVLPPGEPPVGRGTTHRPAMTKYDPHAVEAKWQERWSRDRSPDREEAAKPRFYFLLMFPYPSGALHCGHWFMYAPPDAKARYLRMKGYNVLFPMGFDSFGLPAENAAIKRNIHPRTWTMRNIEQMRASFRAMGASFDWSREIVTCEPSYYKWTQWLFLEMFRNGLAYRSFAPVDWCPRCNTTLAREQVIGEGRECERCQTPVTKRELNQWFFRITRYADELLDFTGIDWPDRVKLMQTNWIGRSQGGDLHFQAESGDRITVFTTRADTAFGVTFIALAPEHPLVEKLTTPACRDAVERYVKEARRQSEVQRLSVARDKTGVPTGAYAHNAANGERVPIFVGDYVLMQYGSGAVMGVPGHDQRDFEFARTHGLPVRVVVAPPSWNGAPLAQAFEDEGMLVHSGQFDGTPSKDASRQIIQWLEERGFANSVVRYRIRDWLISRQRYWGAPIPIVHCAVCGTVPVPVEQLPVLLPDDVDFVPTGESPLRGHEAFVRTTCPRCGGPAERETDTMDTFVDSSWYWLRYLSPGENKAFFDARQEASWLPVTEYAGGVEHATMHLLYARFFTKALRDMGHLHHGEPFSRLFNQGLVLGADGEKMSKSRGNVVDPDDVVARHGSDVLRCFLMFLGPWSRGGPWSGDGIIGLSRFLHKVWALVVEPAKDALTDPSDDQARAVERKLHQTIRKVGHDLEGYNFNTAIASLMELVNELTTAKRTIISRSDAWKKTMETLALLLAPFAPHLAEELWEVLGHADSIHRQAWPIFDPALAQENTFSLVVQVNGRVRDSIEVARGIGETEARELALRSEAVRRHLGGKQPARVIYVPERLVNVVVK